MTKNKFKIYFGDTGLFVAMLDDEASDDLRANRNLGVYKSSLKRYGNPAMTCTTTKKEDSTLEQDFFVRTREWLVPVEVKSKKAPPNPCGR